MKKTLLAAILILAIGGTSMAQTPTKDSTATAKHHTMKKKHHKKTTAVKPAAAPATSQK